MKISKTIASLALGCAALVGTTSCHSSQNATASSADNQAFVFAYFNNNGEDGLHLAYSTDGLSWTALNNDKALLAPEIGKDKLMRDPSICQGPDGTFHMVWTSGWWDQIIGYASSKDLVNWSEQREIPVMTHEPEAKNSWAPELFYDDATGLYHIFWATTIPGRHSAIDDSETEKDLNHRIYRTTTRDFKTFTPTEMFFNPDFSAIDAIIIREPWHNQYLMLVKNENPNPPQKNIRTTTTSSIEAGFPTSVSAPITGDYWAEGPTPIIMGKTMIVYFDKYMNHRYGAVRSTDGEHWEDISDQISVPKGIRHGTAFPVSRKVLNNLIKKTSK